MKFFKFFSIFFTICKSDKIIIDPSEIQTLEIFCDKKNISCDKKIFVMKKIFFVIKKYLRFSALSKTELFPKNFEPM